MKERNVRHFESDVGGEVAQFVSGGGEGLSKREMYLLACSESKFQVAANLERQVRAFGNALAQEMMRIEELRVMEKRWGEAKARMEEMVGVMRPMGSYWGCFVDTVSGVLGASSMFVERIAAAICEEVCWSEHVVLLGDVLPVAALKRVFECKVDDGIDVELLSKVFSVLPAAARDVFVSVFGGRFELGDRRFLVENFVHLSFLCEMAEKLGVKLEVVDGVVDDVVKMAYEASNPFAFLLKYLRADIPQRVKLALDRKMKGRIEGSPCEHGAYLAHFVNFCFRGLKGPVEYRVLEVIRRWFELLTDRASFVVYHKNNLIQRIFTGNWYAIAADIELQKMLRISIVDSILSDYLKTQCITESIDIKSPKMRFHVLSSCLIPWSEVCDMVVPPDIRAALEQFKTQFARMLPHSRLHWDYELTQCVLSVENSHLKQIKCDAVTAVVLMALNQELTTTELENMLHLDASKIDETLSVLEKMSLVSRHHNKWRLSITTTNTKISIPKRTAPIQKLQAVNVYPIDAQLVRIIKSHGHVSESSLIGRFRDVFRESVDDELLQQRIQSLIDRQLIFSDTDHVLSFHL